MKKNLYLIILLSLLFSCNQKELIEQESNLSSYLETYEFGKNEGDSLLLSYVVINEDDYWEVKIDRESALISGVSEDALNYVDEFIEKANENVYKFKNKLHDFNNSIANESTRSFESYQIKLLNPSGTDQRDVYRSFLLHSTNSPYSCNIVTPLSFEIVFGRENPGYSITYTDPRTGVPILIQGLEEKVVTYEYFDLILPGKLNRWNLTFNGIGAVILQSQKYDLAGLRITGHPLATFCEYIKHKNINVGTYVFGMDSHQNNMISYEAIGEANFNYTPTRIYSEFNFLNDCYEKIVVFYSPTTSGKIYIRGYDEVIIDIPYF